MSKKDYLAVASLLALASAINPTMGEEAVMSLRREVENEKESLPHNKPTPKGTKLYFFNTKGEFSTDHTLKADVVFECFAINDKNAIRKFKKR